MTVNIKNWQELKKPNTLEVRPGNDPQRRATFIAEPLERGFGLTLGNALRRVLLSSLQGAAVTSIRIENVLHEFSSLAGVREDVTDIVLNVKQIALKMQGEGPKRLQLSVTGPAEVKAGDIAVTGDIEVTNKDLVICHLDEGATLNMELTADTGKGYVPAVGNRPADAPIGLIPIDSLYSPVRQVSYKVDNARIGQELDYDKLNLTVETDGTISPREALASAGATLTSLVNLVATLDEEPQGLELGDVGAALGTSSELEARIEDLGLTERARNCLKRAGINSIGELVNCSEKDLLSITNFGQTSLKDVNERLDERGLALRTED